MLFLSDTPWWYWLVAAIVTLYHAWRGARWQWIIANRAREESKADIVVLRCVEDGLFHFVCSAAGFLALVIANNLYGSLALNQPKDTGTSVLIAFCFLIGITGISGQLAPLIQLGKIPGATS
jgi:hypothetical protein